MFHGQTLKLEKNNETSKKWSDEKALTPHSSAHASPTSSSAASHSTTTCDSKRIECSGQTYKCIAVPLK